MTAEKRMPAEVFPPGAFIREELEARGWDEEDLAIRMGPEEDFNRNHLTVRLIIEVPEYKGHATLMGDGVAEQLAIAFGTSAGVWEAIERRWVEYLKLRN